jgi:hypothetical protein
LKFRSHAVVTFLSLFQVESNLMHVSQSVQIFVLVKQLLFLFEFSFAVLELIGQNSSLQVRVGFLKSLEFS